MLQGLLTSVLLLTSAMPAVLEPPAPPSFGPYQGGFVSGEGWTQVLWYNYTTGESLAEPAVPAPYNFGYAVPNGQWVGVYLYDYTYGQFSWGMYTFKEAFPVVL